ncbi:MULTISPECIES: phosphoglycerate mutase family protein [unclassified Acinetobacter]|uniref:phosphoglycerate mutase family protein n=1 Tax=unclassified Acinetobacter TaxID=196816 RepID=UPI002934BA16|nr:MULTISPECIES: phosphoglycerate mutase family protein [unclassified Acinetobacter]WOE31713.1 phosphoglycerate mutase family protein [Acinetobacter sp. SAAs470]WOE37179.1 phosphoglycerate mutase family protein [Acinetobacter sp. SAAs474]
MQITLVRHGEAAAAVLGNDKTRPLTTKGHLQAEHSAQFLKNQLQPDVFVVSPLLRAQETLAHLQHYFPQVPVVICNAIQPDDDAKVAVEWLAQLPYESIVVVCHMNVIAHIASILTTETFDPYALAEARIYKQAVIAAGLSTEVKRYIPTP